MTEVYNFYMKIILFVACACVFLFAMTSPVRSDAPGADRSPVGAPPEPAVAAVVAPAPVAVKVKSDTPCFVVRRNGRIVHDFTRSCPEYGNPRNGDPVY